MRLGRIFFFRYPKGGETRLVDSTEAWGAVLTKYKNVGLPVADALQAKEGDAMAGVPAFGTGPGFDGETLMKLDQAQKFGTQGLLGG